MNSNINIDVRDLKEILCPKCGHNGFFKVTFLRYAPAILVGQPNPVMIGTEQFQCGKCESLFSEWEIVQHHQKSLANGKDSTPGLVSGK